MNISEWVNSENNNTQVRLRMTACSMVSLNISIYISTLNYAMPSENNSSHITQHQDITIAVVYFVNRVEICGMK